jgi:hypothetical protein
MLDVFIDQAPVAEDPEEIRGNSLDPKRPGRVVR